MCHLTAESMPELEHLRAEVVLRRLKRRREYPAIRTLALRGRAHAALHPLVAVIARGAADMVGVVAAEADDLIPCRTG